MYYTTGQYMSYSYYIFTVHPTMKSQSGTKTGAHHFHTLPIKVLNSNGKLPWVLYAIDDLYSKDNFNKTSDTKDISS